MPTYPIPQGAGRTGEKDRRERERERIRLVSDFSEKYGRGPV